MQVRLIALLSMFLVGASCCDAAEPKSLFNGKSLNGWEGNPNVWSVVDGAIVGQTTADAPIENNTFLIRKDLEVRDFRLRLQYRIEGGNSGVQYRSRVVDPAKWIVNGYQADIDSGPTYTGILYEEGGRGILAQRGQRLQIARDGTRTATNFGDAAHLQEKLRPDAWNDYVIEAQGERLRHTINGELMSETIDGDREKRAASGVLALQVHRGPPMTVRFRKILLEPLGDKEGESK